MCRALRDSFAEHAHRQTSKKRLSRAAAGSEWEPSASGKSPHLLFLQDYRAVTVAVLIVFFLQQQVRKMNLDLEPLDFDFD